jgi:hypothetical protein
VLAQRAASEGPRWTRAVEDQSAPIPEEKMSELGERIISRLLRPCWTVCLSILQNCPPVVPHVRAVEISTHLYSFSASC